MLSGITNNASSSTLPKSSQSTDYKMEFLKLLMVQLKNQDPTQPFDSQKMLAEQAQFASLEQMQNINVGLSTLLAQQNVSQATNLLGRIVSGTDTNGNEVSGTVKGIDFTDGVTMLTVDLGGGQSAQMGLPKVASIAI